MARNLLLLVASLLAVATGLELVMRSLFPPAPIWREPQTRHLPSPLLGWVLPPDTRSFSIDAPVAINGHGLRDDPMPRDKPPGEERVLALGDSFTFALGVRFENLWVQRLERRLAAAHRDAPHQVINAAVAGYNTRQQLIYLRAEGLSFEPDLVVVAFYWNDLIGNEEPLPDLGATPLYAEEGARRSEDDHTLPSGLRNLLRRSTLLYQVVIRTKMLAQQLRPPDDGYSRAQRALLEGDAAALAPLREATARRLRQLAGTARARGIPALLVRFPMENRLRLDGARPAPFDLGGWLEEVWAETGFPFVDLEEPYRAALRRGENPFLPYDLHPGPAGMRIAAEHVEAAIRRHGLLPCAAGGP